LRVAELITQRGVYNILAFFAAERLRSTSWIKRYYIIIILIIIFSWFFEYKAPIEKIDHNINRYPTVDFSIRQQKEIFKLLLASNRNELLKFKGKAILISHFNFWEGFHREELGTFLESIGASVIFDKRKKVESIDPKHSSNISYCQEKGISYALSGYPNQIARLEIKNRSKYLIFREIKANYFLRLTEIESRKIKKYTLSQQYIFKLNSFVLLLFSVIISILLYNKFTTTVIDKYIFPIAASAFFISVTSFINSMSNVAITFIAVLIAIFIIFFILKINKLIPNYFNKYALLFANDSLPQENSYKENHWFNSVINLTLIVQLIILTTTFGVYILDVNLPGLLANYTLGEINGIELIKRIEKLIVEFPKWPWWSLFIKLDILFILLTFCAYFTFKRPCGQKMFLLQCAMLPLVGLFLVNFDQIFTGLGLTTQLFQKKTSFPMVDILLISFSFLSIYHLLGYMVGRYKFFIAFFSLENSDITSSIISSSTLVALMSTIIYDVYLSSKMLQKDITYLFLMILPIILFIIIFMYLKRFKVIGRLFSLYFAKLFNKKEDNHIICVVFDYLGPLCRPTIFDKTIERRMEKNVYAGEANREIDIITAIESIKLERDNIPVEIMVLTPALWKAFSDCLQKMDHFLIYINISWSDFISQCSKSFIKENLKSMEAAVGFKQGRTLACYQKSKKSISRSLKRKEKQWIDGLHKINTDLELSYDNPDEFIHYLPEKIKNATEDYIETYSIWANLEKALGCRYSDLEMKLPEPIFEYINKVKQSKQLVGIFYGMSKTLELMIHFYALCATVIYKSKSPEWDINTFKRETDGASIGTWCDLGKTYAESSKELSLIKWWNSPIDKNTTNCVRELYRAVGVKPSIPKNPTMRHIQDFLITFRNRTTGHGVLTYQVASTTLNHLSIILGKALAGAVDMNVTIGYQSDKIFFQINDLEIDVNFLLKKFESGYYFLNGYHNGCAEYICYLSGEIKIEKGLEIRLDE
jgi:hypothetical protein